MEDVLKRRAMIAVRVGEALLRDVVPAISHAQESQWATAPSFPLRQFSFITEPPSDAAKLSHPTNAASESSHQGDTKFSSRRVVFSAPLRSRDTLPLS